MRTKETSGQRCKKLTRSSYQLQQERLCDWKNAVESSEAGAGAVASGRPSSAATAQKIEEDLLQGQATTLSAVSLGPCNTTRSASIAKRGSEAATT